MPQKGPGNLARNAWVYGPERTLAADVPSVGHAFANWNIAKPVLAGKDPRTLLNHWESATRADFGEA